MLATLLPLPCTGSHDSASAAVTQQRADNKSGSQNLAAAVAVAADGLRLNGCLHLIQAGDDAAAQDVGGLFRHLGDEVAQLAGVGNALLEGSLGKVDLLDQLVFDRAARRRDAQQAAELLDRLAGNLTLALRDDLQALRYGLAGGGHRLDVAALDVEKGIDVETRNLEGLQVLRERVEGREGGELDGVGTGRLGHVNIPEREVMFQSAWGSLNRAYPNPEAA